MDFRQPTNTQTMMAQANAAAQQQRPQQQPNSNMRIYDAGRSVPAEAQKAFNNGRFSGTDINPMWRIKRLTELFGPVGFGWYYDVLSERAETISENTIIAVVDINLYVKMNGEWSKPIYGTGGNTLKSYTAKGVLMISDEGYKMALTDALSVACKALGIGADVYFDKDRTKYTAPAETAPDGDKRLEMATVEQIEYIKAHATVEQFKASEAKYGIGLGLMTKETAQKVIDKLNKIEEEKR